MSTKEQVIDNKFEMTENTKAYIILKLGLDSAMVDMAYGLYQRYVRTMIKNQPLSHYILALEAILREETGNPLFRIICRPLPNTSKILNVGTAQYYKKRFFTVYYHPDMDELQLRDCLAHELSHLFIAEVSSDEHQLKNVPNTEPMASLFGIFYMLDDKDFYKERSLKYSSRIDTKIIDDFIFMAERKSKLKNEK